MDMHFAPARGGSDRDPGGRPQLLDVLVDLRRTMEALDQARVRVAGILGLPNDPSPSMVHMHGGPFYHDFVDSEAISRMRRKNRTLLDDAIFKCLVS